MSHYLFVVEGIHDVAIISKILMLMEFKEVDRDDQILKPMAISYMYTISYSWI